MTARKLNPESFKTLFGTASRVEFRVKSSGSHFLQLHSLFSFPPHSREEPSTMSGFFTKIGQCDSVSRRPLAASDRLSSPLSATLPCVNSHDSP